MSTLLVMLVVLLSTVVPARAAEEKRVSPQAQRMKDCNAQAHDRALAGDARKQFMSDCLKGGGADRPDRSSQPAASPSEGGAPSEPSSQGKR
jgi:psiF repeat